MSEDMLIGLASLDDLPPDMIRYGVKLATNEGEVVDASRWENWDDAAKFGEQEVASNRAIGFWVFKSAKFSDLADSKAVSSESWIMERYKNAPDPEDGWRLCSHKVAESYWVDGVGWRKLGHCQASADWYRCRNVDSRSIREIAEAAGMDVSQIQGEDIDLLTGKRTHND